METIFYPDAVIRLSPGVDTICTTLMNQFEKLQSGSETETSRPTSRALLRVDHRIPEAPTGAVFQVINYSLSPLHKGQGKQ